jgi:hypothetical protein
MFILTKFKDSVGELDIWQMTSFGYYKHVKRVRGQLVPTDTIGLKNPMGIPQLFNHIIAMDDDITKLEGIAAIECLEPPGTKMMATSNTGHLVDLGDWLQMPSNC